MVFSYPSAPWGSGSVYVGLAYTEEKRIDVEETNWGRHKPSERERLTSGKRDEKTEVHEKRVDEGRNLSI